MLWTVEMKNPEMNTPNAITIIFCRCFIQY